MRLKLLQITGNPKTIRRAKVVLLALNAVLLLMLAGVVYGQGFSAPFSPYANAFSENYYGEEGCASYYEIGNTANPKKVCKDSQAVRDCGIPPKEIQGNFGFSCDPATHEWKGGWICF